MHSPFLFSIFLVLFSLRNTTEWIQFIEQKWKIKLGKAIMQAKPELWGHRSVELYVVL